MFDLKKFRKEKKLSQKELAEQIGVTQSFISQIEGGKDPMPEALLGKLKDLYKIEDVTVYSIKPRQPGNSTVSQKERLLEFVNYLGLSKKAFEESVGLSNGYFGSMRKGIGYKAIEQITNKYPNLNPIWLLAGEGNMLLFPKTSSTKSDENVLTGKLIPYFDAEAAAGTGYGVNMNPISQPVGMIEIGGLLKDSESALRVYGNSMTPNYPAGCVVGLRPHQDSFIEPGYVYVVETSDNRYLKRLYYNKDKTAFRCVSDNRMVYENGPMSGEYFYPDFEIPFSEVIRLNRVIGVIKRNVL